MVKSTGFNEVSETGTHQLVERLKDMSSIAKNIGARFTSKQSVMSFMDPLG